MRMPLTVLIATIALAPPFSAARPMVVMSVTFGVSFTQTGTPYDATARVHSSTVSGSVPIAAPYPAAWGQLTFSSKAFA